MADIGEHGKVVEVPIFIPRKIKFTPKPVEAPERELVPVRRAPERKEVHNAA